MFGGRSPGPYLGVAAVVLGLGLLGYGVLFRETDEDRIRGQLERLERAVHTDAESGRNPLVRGANLRGAFSELFEKDVRYRIPELTTGTRGRESLVQLATQATASLTLLDVDFGGVTISLVPGAGLAQVDTTAAVRAFRGAEPYEEGERRVRFDFSKVDGDWLISAFRVSTPDAGEE